MYIFDEFTNEKGERQTIVNTADQAMGIHMPPGVNPRRIAICVLAAQFVRLGRLLAKTIPNINPITIITGTIIGGVAVDLDLIPWFYKKRANFLDKTVGKHRFLPTHTPLFAILAGLAIIIPGVVLSLPILISWGYFYHR